MRLCLKGASVMLVTDFECGTCREKNVVTGLQSHWFDQITGAKRDWQRDSELPLAFVYLCLLLSIMNLDWRLCSVLWRSLIAWLSIQSEWLWSEWSGTKTDVNFIHKCYCFAFVQCYYSFEWYELTEPLWVQRFWLFLKESVQYVEMQPEKKK